MSVPGTYAWAVETAQAQLLNATSVDGLQAIDKVWMALVEAHHYAQTDEERVLVAGIEQIAAELETQICKRLRNEEREAQH